MVYSIGITQASITISEKGVTRKQVGHKTQDVSVNYVIPDLVAQIQSQTSLSKTTIAAILLSSNRLADALNNPQTYIDYVSNEVNTVN
ncbi:hypothetical protein [Fictibacillus sp. S7]|uniref:hypothetical protein n=1 Tax=Fictibacillus sp. S7 TaxID=2212476 RepID=UPI0010126B8F|nr:hypothetical protein [Fictibacillus sp. S7]